MLPSSTVENYLKAIYTGSVVPGGERRRESRHVADEAQDGGLAHHLVEGNPLLIGGEAPISLYT